MKRPTLEEQRALVKLWDTTGPLLEQIRLKELRARGFRPEDAEAALSMTDHYKGPARTTSGLVEMQRIFMKGHPPRKAD